MRTKSIITAAMTGLASLAMAGLFATPPALPRSSRKARRRW